MITDAERYGGPINQLKAIDGFEEKEMWLAYGEEYDVGRKRDKEAKERIKREAQVSRDWEEGRWAGRTGEWRRRRWVRIVKRVSVDGQGDEMTKS